MGIRAPHRAPTNYKNMQVFKIYWCDQHGQAQSQDCHQLTDALQLTEAKRREGMRFVTMVSESSQSVGQPGVAAVVDGQLPDGNDYTWSKAGRAGKVRAGDKIVAAKGSH